MEKITIDIYNTANNYSAHAPILLGCISTAATLSEMKKNIKEAIEYHIESSME